MSTEHPQGRYASFEAFYPYYIHEHSNRTCRRIHVVGTGLVVAAHNGYLVPALTFAGTGGVLMIGIGMWLALIMAFNVWFIIWPAQQKILGLVEATDEAKAAAAPRALAASRTNLLLSLPMLTSMAMYQTLFG